MRIVGARIYLVTTGGRRPVLVEVLTDQGIGGVGEAAIAYGTGATAAADMIKDLAEGCLLGKDPSRIEAIRADSHLPLRGHHGVKPSLQGYLPNSNVVESSWNSNEWWVKR